MSDTVYEVGRSMSLKARGRQQARNRKRATEIESALFVRDRHRRAYRPPGRRPFLLLPLFVVVFFSPAASQDAEFYHPELEWKTIETEHFLVHYHEGSERTGRTVAKIAEEIFEPVTSLYNHKPDQKVSFIIKDYDDISNGAAYFFDNKIEIYAPSMDYELRGTHNWLRNVVTHEFTHIVQIQTSMKFGRKVPALYLQWLNYESERRADVLYGYPNVIVSYPVSGFVVPAWFAEGVAQYNRRELRYDFWDTHRDMILRSYALDGNMLTWEQMGVFGKTSLGNESSYNAGFAFVAYLAQKYGEDKLRDISRNLSSFTEVTIDGAIGRAVGKRGDEVYDEWRKELEKEYTARAAPIRTNLREGERLIIEARDDQPELMERGGGETMLNPRDIIPRQWVLQDPCCRFSESTGFANLYPAYSPDGKKIAYVSTKGADYFSLSSLYVYDFETKKEERIRAGVHTAPAWSPDGKRLYYSRITRDNPHWSFQHDLYAYDLEKEKETRITSGKRARSPAISPDGRKVTFVLDRDGTTNLALADIDGSNAAVITPYVNGEQVYNPQWSPSGDRIIFDYSVRDGRDIATVRPDGSDLRFLIAGPDDSRSGVFTHDGSRIIFSSDRTGVFNLYSLTPATGAIEQVTNVLGGAFCPTVNGAGDITYALYTSGGYKIYQLKVAGIMAEGNYHYLQQDRPLDNGPDGVSAVGSQSPAIPQFDWQALRSYDDTKLPVLQEKSYKNIFTSLTLVPFVRVDNYNTHSKGIDVVKLGVYLFSNDVLEKTGFFAGAAFNRQLERDLFLQFNYRGRIPLLFQLGLEPAAAAELYNVSRKTNSVLTLPASTIPVDVTYNLLEFDFVLDQPFLSQFSDVELRYIHSRYSSSVGSFIDPETDPPSLVPSSGDLYLIGNSFNLTLKIDAIVPSRTSEINPVGRKIIVRLGRELNQFNGDGEYEVSSTGLKPKYKTVNFTRAELTWKEYAPSFFRGHTVNATLRGAAIIGPPVDEFFDFYVGGMVGMKGYPFYALGGNKIAQVGLSYRFPLVQNIDIRFMQVYFDKLYASVFADAGDAWTEGNPTLKGLKRDAGMEIRLESFSFYSYPTRVFFNAAYGFDRFPRYVKSTGTNVTYGREWRFYFGILFGFDLD